MHPVECDHNQQHKSSIKNVEIEFVAEEVTCIALDKFNDTEDTSDHDERASYVEIVKVTLPRKIADVDARDVWGEWGGGRGAG